MSDKLREELMRRGVRPVPSHNTQPAQQIRANPHPVREKISSVLDSVRQQPLSRILDMIGMSPVTDAQRMVQGENPLEVLGPDLAGLPYSRIRRGPVFHGTPFRFDTFDPRRSDPNDSMGWMTHFTENPEYANDWASGAMKNRDNIMFNSGGVGWDVTTKKLYDLDDLVAPVSRNAVPDQTLGPQVIPAKIHAENVFDTLNPDPTDVATVLAALPPERRKVNIDAFKINRQNDPVKYPLGTYGFPSGNTKGGSGYAMDALARSLVHRLRDPRIFQKLPFDAVRYQDGGFPAVAVPPTTPITTPWGTPLNTPQRPDIDLILSKNNRGL